MTFSRSLLLVCCVTILGLYSCKDNDDNQPPDDSSNPEIENPEIENPEIDLPDYIEAYEQDLISDALVFCIPSGPDSTFIMNKQGDVLKTWHFNENMGNEVKLLPNGNLLGNFRTNETTDFSFGGFGGLIKLYDFEGEELWSYDYADQDHLAHHDVIHLDNGHIMFIAWERLSVADAATLGINTTEDIYPDTLVEVDPTTNEIVWKWRAADHSIQDVHPEITDTYGDVAANPQKINVNFNLEGGNGDLITNGNIMHCNGIFYDSIKDVIYLSIYMYSEVWVIDHSTTMAEAASDTGGSYNKGGDLLYRFGNPTAYKNTAGSRMFYHTHTPRIIPQGYPGAGNFLVFMNGDEDPGTFIYEFEMPENFILTPDQDNEPNVVWSYHNDDLYYVRISSAMRLKNGNTLICEGDYGVWEVTEDGQIAWKYNYGSGNLWRAYPIERDFPAISGLDLD